MCLRQNIWNTLRENCIYNDFKFFWNCFCKIIYSVFYFDQQRDNNYLKTSIEWISNNPFYWEATGFQSAANETIDKHWPHCLNAAWWSFSRKQHCISIMYVGIPLPQCVIQRIGELLFIRVKHTIGNTMLESFNKHSLNTFNCLCNVTFCFMHLESLIRYKLLQNLACHWMEL